MDLGAAIVLGAATVGIVNATSKWFSERDRTATDAIEGRVSGARAVQEATALDKQTALLTQRFDALEKSIEDRHLTIQEFGGSIAGHDRKLIEHAGELANFRAALLRQEESNGRAFDRMAASIEQQAHANAAIARALDRVADNIDMTTRISRVEGILSGMGERRDTPTPPPNRITPARAQTQTPALGSPQRKASP